MSFAIIESDELKVCRSEDYNYVFRKDTGMFARWGKTMEEDPETAPCPEIMDLEISTVCSGVPTNGKASPCKFCYKANGPRGKQMSKEKFEQIFERLPKSITQIAFGIGDLVGHDDMWDIFDHTKAGGVIPNVTTNGWGLTDEIAERLANTMGAVAVSRYNPPDVCYDAVKKLTDLGMSQVNIHQVVSSESYDDCLQLVSDCETDPRLEKLNAVVFLMLKPKGRAKSGMTKISRENYSNLVDTALTSGIGVGFDSCSAPSFLDVTADHPDHKSFEMTSDACEAGCFSIYANVDGEVFPCSFTEGTEGWETGIPIVENEFIDDIWNSNKVEAWRKRLLGNCRSCPIYDVDVKDEGPLRICQ